MKRLINSKNVTSMQVFQFKKEALKFLARLCSHAMEKSPFRSLLARHLECLSPNIMVESSRSCKLMFEKILEKLVCYNSCEVGKLMLQNLSFESFSQLQWKRTRIPLSNLTKKLIGLKPLFGSFSLIPTNLSCYKSCSKCKRGFSVNGKLLIENLHTESLIAQRHIHYHMQSYDLQAHDLDITHELLNFVSSARKHYFQSQRER